MTTLNNSEILSTAGVLKLLGWSKNKFTYAVYKYPLEPVSLEELTKCGHLCIRTFKYYRKQEVLDWAESFLNKKRKSPGAQKRKG